MTARGDFLVEWTHGGGMLCTRGLAEYRRAEICLAKPGPGLELPAFAMLRTLGEFALERAEPVSSGEKVSYGYWVLELRTDVQGKLRVYESAADGSHYRDGANLALAYWVEQSEVCSAEGAPLSAPRPEQKVATSVGVLEGDLPVSGVRYVAPDHMCGWYLTADRYSGDSSSLRVDHLYHLTALRPDLVKFLALPAGYRFELTAEGGRVTFDKDVAGETLEA